MRALVILLVIGFFAHSSHAESTDESLSFEGQEYLASEIADRLLDPNLPMALVAEARLLHADDSRRGDAALNDKTISVYFLIERAYRGGNVNEILNVRVSSDILESEYLLGESRWNTRNRLHIRMREQIAQITEEISFLEQLIEQTEDKLSQQSVKYADTLMRLVQKRKALYDRRRGIPQYAGGVIHGEMIYELGGVINPKQTYLLVFMQDDVTEDATGSVTYTMSFLAHDNLYWGNDKEKLIRAIERH